MINIHKIKSNLTRIDAAPNGIFFMSYNTPIAFIYGVHEFVTSTSYSSTTTAHVNHLLGDHIVQNATRVDERFLVQKCKEAGINCL